MAEYEMTLVDRQRIAKDTMAFWFDTNGANFEFRAGQHADFVFTHPRTGSEIDNSRTFSLASSPHDKEPIMIAMRMRSSQPRKLLPAAVGPRESSREQVGQEAGAPTRRRPGAETIASPPIRPSRSQPHRNA